jgi:hypothetical protein
MDHIEIARKIVNGFDKNLHHMEQLKKISNVNDWGDESDQRDIFIKLMDNINTEAPTLIELGSSGTDSSVYSILFEKRFNYNCKIINTEPRKELLDLVRSEWKDLHLINAKLYHGYTGIGTTLPNKESIPLISMKQLFEENNIEKLDILHVDIQGDEVSVCQELEKDDLFKKIRYIFMSTHYQCHGLGNYNTYNDCLQIINKNINSKFYWSDPYKGGCGDGLIIVENLDY